MALTKFFVGQRVMALVNNCFVPGIIRGYVFRGFYKVAADCDAREDPYGRIEVHVKNLREREEAPAEVEGFTRLGVVAAGELAKLKEALND